MYVHFSYALCSFNYRDLSTQPDFFQPKTWLKLIKIDHNMCKNEWNQGGVVASSKVRLLCKRCVNLARQLKQRQNRQRSSSLKWDFFSRNDPFWRPAALHPVKFRNNSCVFSTSIPCFSFSFEFWVWDWFLWEYYLIIQELKAIFKLFWQNRLFQLEVNSERVIDDKEKI